MKRIVSVTEVEGEGLIGLMGQRVTIFALNYIYEGKLTGVNTDDLLLEDACIVYETGELMATKRKDAQALPGPLYVRVAAIESYTVLK
jgi:hypothetical protein